jgi:hypothetical protein
VLGYCGFAEETAAFSRRRELATANAVLVVGFDGPLEVSFPTLGEDLRAGGFVSGVSDAYAVVDSFGSQRGVQVDLTPKTLARVLRFGRAMRLLRAEPRPELAEIATECGY